MLNRYQRVHIYQPLPADKLMSFYCPSKILSILILDGILKAVSLSNCLQDFHSVLFLILIYLARCLNASFSWNDT